MYTVCCYGLYVCVCVYLYMQRRFVSVCHRTNRVKKHSTASEYVKCKFNAYLQPIKRPHSFSTVHTHTHVNLFSLQQWIKYYYAYEKSL